MIKNLLKKSLAIVLLISISGGMFISLPKKSHAQVVPSLDKANLVQNTYRTKKELVLDAIVNIAMKAFIRQLTGSILNWINSGFNGNPSFVSNPSSFLLGVADRTIGEFVEGTELGFLCDPFRLDIRLALGLQYRPFRDQVTCTLTEIIANTRGSIEDFTNGNFIAGGWQGWLSLTTQPTNNPYGAFLYADNELSVRIAGKEKLELAKLNWGQGFLSWEKCRPTEVHIESSTEGTGEGEYTGPERSTEGTGEGGVGDEICEIQTPGSVISGQLNHVLGSGLRQAELADEINESISAIAGALVQQAFTQGLRALTSASNGSSSSYVERLKAEKDREKYFSIRDQLSADIDLKIVDEVEYGRAKSSSLESIKGAEDALNSAQVCFENKLTVQQTPPLSTIEISNAQKQISDSKNTKNLKIQPLKDELNLEIDKSKAISTALQNFRVNLKSENIDVIRKAVEGYDAFVAKNAPHGFDEVERARTQSASISGEMGAVKIEAENDLKDCRNRSLFPNSIIR